jgi:hypothetical protein
MSRGLTAVRKDTAGQDGRARICIMPGERVHVRIDQGVLIHCLGRLLACTTDLHVPLPVRALLLTAQLIARCVLWSQPPRAGSAQL